MNAIYQTSRETIQIRCRSGVIDIAAHRYGDFAAHPRVGEENALLPSEFVITHLPTGHRIADGFRSLDLAAEAMAGLQRLRNDWAVVGREDLTDDCREACRTAVLPFGGDVPRGPGDLPKIPLNRYEEIVRQ